MASFAGRAAFVDDLREAALGIFFAVAMPVASPVARGPIRRIGAGAALPSPLRERAGTRVEKFDTSCHPDSAQAGRRRATP